MKLICGEDKPIPSSTFSEMASFLSGYNYKIIYSKQVPVADFLSHLPSQDLTEGDKSSQNYIINVNANSLYVRSIPDEIQKDEVLRNVMQWTRESWTKTLPVNYPNKVYQTYFSKRAEITVEHNCLFRGSKQHQHSLRNSDKLSIKCT